MQRILIAGGNSGIGLETARQLTAAGHAVVLLGRDRAKGEVALTELAQNSGEATFFAADLATHAGVEAAAAMFSAAYDHFDVLLHTTGVLRFDDVRTADGMHPFFAVNYLSRYHLTQRLLPLLRRSSAPRVIMLSSHIELDTKIDFDQYPLFSPFDFGRARASIQFSNHHYAMYLSRTEPTLRAAVVNAGLADTGIWRELPPAVRENMLQSRQLNSIAESALVPVALCLNEDWASPTYWGVVGELEAISLELDPAETARVIAICHGLTGEG